MRSVTRMTAAAGLAAVLVCAATAQQSPTDRALLDAASKLEKAAATATPADQKKLKEGFDFLRGLIRGGGKTDNHHLLDFNDNPSQFKGKTLTFEMQLAETSGDGLREFSQDKPTCGLSAKVGTPPATVRLVVDYSKIWNKVVNAHTGDRVVVTFDCTEGEVKSGNQAKSITRP